MTNQPKVLVEVPIHLVPYVVSFIKSLVDEPVESVPSPVRPVAWTWADWTPERLQKAKTVASERPVTALIADKTSQGEVLSPAQVREELGLSIQGMNAQLGWFTKKVKTEIAPHWEGLTWHWPFAYYPNEGLYRMSPEDGGNLAIAVKPNVNWSPAICL